MKYIQSLRARAKFSESLLANQAGLSRLTLRQLESGRGNPTLASLRQVAEALDRELIVLLAPREASPSSDYSVPVISMKVVRDGFDTWPIHFMEMVDEFRRHWDLRLLMLPPVPQLDVRLRSLIASIVMQLCEDAAADSPQWARGRHYLPRPWFVSETESLKAFAILESPLAFRKNNIFVQENFLARA